MSVPAKNSRKPESTAAAHTFTPPPMPTLSKPDSGLSCDSRTLSVISAPGSRYRCLRVWQLPTSCAPSLPSRPSSRRWPSMRPLSCNHHRSGAPIWPHENPSPLPPSARRQRVWDSASARPRRCGPNSRRSVSSPAPRPTRSPRRGMSPPGHSFIPPQLLRHRESRSPLQQTRTCLAACRGRARRDAQTPRRSPPADAR